jgi:hypothetical protein
MRFIIHAKIPTEAGETFFEAADKAIFEEIRGIY